MKELTPELKLLHNHIRHSNPNFTKSSLFRTIELIIIQARNLFFMTKIDEDEILEVYNSIPKEWLIKDRIRDI